MGLEAGNPEYTQIVKNLAALTGMTNDGYCLDAREMRYCIESDMIPINLNALYAPVDPAEPVCFISKRRFDDNMDLAVMIMGHYELPDDPAEPKQSNMDGFMNLLLCGQELCEKVYVINNHMATMEKTDHTRNRDIDNQPGGDALDFNL